MKQEIDVVKCKFCGTEMIYFKGSYKPQACMECQRNFMEFQAMGKKSITMDELTKKSYGNK